MAQTTIQINTLPPHQWDLDDYAHWMGEVRRYTRAQMLAMNHNDWVNSTLYTWQALGNAFKALNINPLASPTYFVTWRAGLKALMQRYFAFYNARGYHRADGNTGYATPGPAAYVSDDTVPNIDGATPASNRPIPNTADDYEPSFEWAGRMQNEAAEPFSGGMVIRFGSLGLLRPDGTGEITFWPTALADVPWTNGNLVQQTVEGSVLAASNVGDVRYSTIYPSGSQWWQLAQDIAAAMSAKTPEALFEEAATTALLRTLAVVKMFDLSRMDPDLAAQMQRIDDAAQYAAGGTARSIGSTMETMGAAGISSGNLYGVVFGAVLYAGGWAATIIPIATGSNDPGNDWYGQRILAFTKYWIVPSPEEATYTPGLGPHAVALDLKAKFDEQHPTATRPTGNVAEDVVVVTHAPATRPAPWVTAAKFVVGAAVVGAALTVALRVGQKVRYGTPVFRRGPKRTR